MNKIMTEVVTLVANSSMDSGASRAEELPLPRITLRKRKDTSERDSVCIPSVNSDLLDGLFADVAEIQQSCNHPIGFVGHEEVDSTKEFHSPQPTKKSRCSLTHSISRSPKSFKWLGDVLFPSVPDFSTQAFENSTGDDLTRQVTPVGSKKSTTSKIVSRSSAAIERCIHLPSFATKFSFPHLPPAVSSSSCGTLPRIYSDLQSSAEEKDDRESYGWFVEMDGGETQMTSANPYSKSFSSHGLAFVASTAPNAVNQDDEVEWAKAADTVDSVLADFF